jgi:hypothetical protein
MTDFRSNVAVRQASARSGRHSGIDHSTCGPIRWEATTRPSASSPNDPTPATTAGLRAALSDLQAATTFPLGVSPPDFDDWYSRWWPDGNDAKPGTGLMRDWFAEAEAEVHDGRPLSDNTMAVLALIAKMRTEKNQHR